jgi:hypothetical protein
MVLARDDRHQRSGQAQAFYDALLGTLAVGPARLGRHRIFYIAKTGVFAVTKPVNGEPTTLRERQHNRLCLLLDGTGRQMACGRRRSRRNADRKSIGHPRGFGRQALPRLPANPDGNKICAMNRVV